jgi:hypothetical protein
MKTGTRLDCELLVAHLHASFGDADLLGPEQRSWQPQGDRPTQRSRLQLQANAADASAAMNSPAPAPTATVSVRSGVLRANAGSGAEFTAYGGRLTPMSSA